MSRQACTSELRPVVIGMPAVLLFPSDRLIVSGTCLYWMAIMILLATLTHVNKRKN